MRRMSFKPDASFFKYIAIGAVGVRAVIDDMNRHGHELRELERGATETKLWKDIKRKRIRIPDLVCTRCGLRIESRAKTARILAMSHSRSERERSWDYGMVDDDLIAFPVCSNSDELYESTGRLHGSMSYWRERRWDKWIADGGINYLAVRCLRAIAPDENAEKGVTEGSEGTVAWSSIFSSRDGLVECIIENRKIRVRFDDGRCYTWENRKNLPVVAQEGQRVQAGQLLASKAIPITLDELTCRHDLNDNHLARLIESRERTQRFTGVKLARLLRRPAFVDAIRPLFADPEEDAYVRMEAACYLATVCDMDARGLFGDYLADPDDQVKLETVITLAEVPTDQAVNILAEILTNGGCPFFLRSAAAWALSCIGGRPSVQHLLTAFSDVDSSIRQEALTGIIAMSGDALPHLLDGMVSENADIAAGCAEAIREIGNLSPEMIARLAADAQQVNVHPWITWLLGNLPREQVAPFVAQYQDARPELHYALSVLWCFVESWIAQQWEPYIPGSHPVVEE